MIPGRSCPLHYRRRPEALARTPERVADRLYVAGGVYGNLEALETLAGLADQEAATLCLNGDYHWFDAASDWFARIEAEAARHVRTAGNVEYELARPSDAGCGCAYPETVPAAFVERSNRIMDGLQQAAGAAERAALAGLPLDLRIDVGELRVGVIHGDPESLAGWALAVEAAEGDPAGFTERVADWFRRGEVDVIACAHTCLPHAHRLVVDGRERVVINNGAAGMGNFRGDTRGLVTRIAPESAANSLYGTELHGMVVEAVPLAYDIAAWRRRFEAVWVAGSPAALNYADRIVAGPHYARERALGAGITPR